MSREYLCSCFFALAAVFLLADAVTLYPGLGDYGEHVVVDVAPLAERQTKALRYHKPAKKENRQDFSKIPGTPGVDYPIYHSVPETRFSCNNVPAHPGIYANVETGCQAYHVCHDGREGHQGAAFLCTNGTLFNQKEFACDWWYNVNCHEAQDLYRLNLDPLKNPYVPKPKPEHLQPEKFSHQQQPQKYVPLELSKKQQHYVPSRNYYY